jgi:cytosine/adenosine deaminase-related metal-dependent hydrolase
MIDILVTNGTVLPMDNSGRVVHDGAVAIDDGEIVAVGPTDELRSYQADREIDASNRAVLPGFVNAHTHVSDILLRGGHNTGRTLFDWLFNVKKPGVAAMTPADHEVAARLYTVEALRAGVTTFVELPEAILLADDAFDDVVEAKFGVYDEAGVRAVFAVTFSDNPDVPPPLERLVGRLVASEPGVEHTDPAETVLGTEEAMTKVEEVIERYGTGGAVQEVWPSPEHVWTVTPEGFRRARALAEEYDVRTTTHASESVHDECERLSNVEYLDGVGYLSPRTVLAHGVHVDDRDVRLLAETGTAVVHNPLANLALGSGIAPVPSMRSSGVTVGLGTDNPSASDTVNPLGDMRFAAQIHKGATRDASAMAAGDVLRMVTRDAAEAIGLASDVGSLEPGKRADVVLVDVEQPHATPQADIASTLVYQSMGADVETVICDGTVVVEKRTVQTASVTGERLYRDGRETAAAVAERAGLDTLG